MEATPRPRVVIVGGGFGGLQCALKLAKVPVDVTLVDRENHHLFQPLLYQIATAGLAPASIAAPIRAIVGEQLNTTVLLAEVVDVSLDEQRVLLSDGESLPFDYLVLAAGAQTNYFGNDAWAQHAHGLKEMRDAIRIRERVLLAFEAAEREPDPSKRLELLTFVVIGGGPTGVEMAGAISELGRYTLARDFRRVAPGDIRVLLVEMADRLLQPFDARLSASAEEQLRKLGVEVMLGQRVNDVDGCCVRIDGELIPASVVIWASGVRAVPLPQKMGLACDRGGRAKVDSSCAVLGHPRVFAIGDLASFVPEGQEEALPGLAPVAMQQGRHVARQIAREVQRKPREPFHYVDKGIMATIGRNQAVAQTSLPLLGELRLRGFTAWLAWLFIHVLYLIGFRNRLIVIINWAWSYFSFKKGARLITAYIPGVHHAELGPPPLDVEETGSLRTSFARSEAKASERD